MLVDCATVLAWLEERPEQRFTAQQIADALDASYNTMLMRLQRLVSVKKVSLVIVPLGSTGGRPAKYYQYQPWSKDEG